MKIGHLFITWKTPQQRVQVTSIARRWLEDRNEGRVLVARLARSEVKNYLAEIAEEAEMPFVSPASFLYTLHVQLAKVSLTNLERDRATTDGKPVAEVRLATFEDDCGCNPDEGCSCVCHGIPGIEHA